jgi:bifunctional aspartokinase / homoserine dehydrogenase 1
MSSALQIMKFGGTSVGDATCIARTAQIVAKAARENPCVVVVSAMSGVTNRLIEAARKAATGDSSEGGNLTNVLRSQHAAALDALIQEPKARQSVMQKLDGVLAEAKRLCDGTALLRELTPRSLDEISSLGERLSAPIVAAAVGTLSLRSESIDATELIVTDAFHGGAEPHMELTRDLPRASCRSSLVLSAPPLKASSPP